MKWKKDTAADIVMGAAAKVAEDMVHGTASAIRDISEYHSMYKNMERALNDASNNLKKHLLRKKWMSKEDRKAIRSRISQINAMAKICRRMQGWCSGFAGGTIMELKKFEGNKKLKDVVLGIETEETD